MAGNAPNDWFPLPTGNHQVDENQRRIWQSLYYLRDQQQNNHNIAVPGGMSGTAVFAANFTMGNAAFESMVFKDGRLVAVTPLPPSGKASLVVTNGANNNGGVPLTSGGVPTSSTPVPSGTPVVSALPGPTDPLSVVGQYVIYNGKPYIYTAGYGSGSPDFWALDVTGVPLIRDVWANLPLYPAASYPLGTVFYATDWLISYAVQQPGGVNTWIYYNGIYEAALASIPTALIGTYERNLIFRASDYLHNWIWSGSAWSLTTGGFHPGDIYYYASPSLVPNSDALWQVCDGSTVPVSQDNATLVNTAVPVRPNNYYVR